MHSQSVSGADTLPFRLNDLRGPRRQGDLAACARPILVAGLTCILAVGLSAGETRAETREKIIAALEPFRGQTVVQITLAGNHVTQDLVIHREIWTEVGQPLEPELVADDIVRLENLAVFGSVEATADAQPDGVSLDYTFTEMPWIIPFPAVSYTEENGFSLGLGVASPNFRGRDITLSFSALFGGVTTYRFQAENPWITGNHVSGGFEAGHQTRPNKLLDFRQTSDVVALAGGVYLGERGRLNGEIGFYGVGSDQPDITIDGDGYDSIIFGGIAIGMDTRDSWRVPHSGWQNELALVYSGYTADSWALDLDIRRYQPLGARHTLALGPLLSLQSGVVGRQIPTYMQYFLGGANSVRGYKLEELGKEFYGKHQLLATVEYRYLLLAPTALRVFKWTFGVGLEAAAFGDVGVVWSRPEDLNIDRTRSGTGVGLRVLLPSVESVRFDFGVGDRGDIVFNFATRSIFDARSDRER